MNLKKNSEAKIKTFYFSLRLYTFSMNRLYIANVKENDRSYNFMSNSHKIEPKLSLEYNIIVQELDKII